MKQNPIEHPASSTLPEDAMAAVAAVPGKDPEFELFLESHATDERAKAFARRLFYGLHCTRLFPYANGNSGAASTTRISVLEDDESYLDEGERIADEFKQHHPDRLRAYRR